MKLRSKKQAESNALLDIGDIPRLIYRQLKDKILSGELVPGEQVKIQEIADETGASAVPVREAIRMLASEGLMQLRTRRSPIVAPLELREIAEIANIRLALEPFILNLAISRHTPDTLKECHSLIIQDMASNSFNEKVDLNRKFHLALLAPAQQPRALRIISDQFENVSRYAQMLVMRGLGNLGGNVHKEHLDILTKVESGSAEPAVQMLAEHIRSAVQRIEQELNRLTDEQG
ncbi:MAG: GntR family transcriptional regulator [Albidovulum sp.]|nr:GntR family transcriptional regulator [Albidovulum sp.]MDE0304113.1 GntR family transcriptional regulator [Albidovulum sp.]MDE0533380.1 GntR family transcriptional regulator [Albidovulum sp.]